ncbi:GATA zinc finger domain-containing protein 14-like isoform X2 [Planococcus citri]|uniref:GATA zinc finger domain-containing protein 14-like isoform X2 n=1 Tax=Planococcus citri TaxID=170843 RepID=UPI0031F9D245
MKSVTELCLNHFQTTKNGFTRAKQDEDDRFFNNDIKKFDTAEETSIDQGYERQAKNKNDHGSIYRKDEKENLNIQRNEYRNHSGQHFNSQNQKYSRNFDNKSPNHDRSEGENVGKKDQRYSRQPQSRNYNQNNRGYNRTQERSNQQNNYNRNDAKNRSNYQNTPRIQHFQKNSDNNAEESSRSNENSFSHVSSNYSKQGSGLTQEKSTPGIHYQRRFPSKTSNKNCSFNVANNQSAKSIAENFFSQTEQFAQLNLSSENCTSSLENISNHYQNFNSADNYSTHSFSDQFTAGISEPVPTNVHPNDTFRTSIQVNQSSNIPVTTANFVDSYVSSGQSRVNNNFADCSYSNQITASSSSQSLMNDNFCDCSCSRQIAAIRPPSRSLVSSNFASGSYLNQITAENPSSPSMLNDNLTDGSYLNPVSAIRPASRLLAKGNLVNFPYSNHITAGNSPSQSLMNDNLSDYPYSNQIAPIRPPSRSLVNGNFTNCSRQNPVLATCALPKDEVSQFGNKYTSNDVISTTFSSLSPHVADFIPRQNRIQNSNQMEFPSAANLQLDGNLENTYAFSSSTLNNSQHRNATWSSQSNVSSCNETINFRNGVEMLPTFFQNDSSVGLSGVFSQQQTAAPDTPRDGQLFNFNGHMVNLSGKDNQPVVNEYAPSYDNAQNIYSHPNNSIDGQFNYDINGSPGTDNYPENLSFNNQQISNILQIASLNLDQESISIPPSGCQRINDMFQMADVNVNVNENIVGQTNASILSQTVVNNPSNLSHCEVRRNSRVNIMQDYYMKPAADVANNLKSNESEELNSTLEKVAQQLFNVNKYVTNAEMNTGTITTKDTVCDSNNSKQFNMASFKRYKSEQEKYRQYENISINNGNNTLLSSSGSNTYYENSFMPVPAETCKSYESFPSQIPVSSNFISNQDQQFLMGSRYYDGNLNNNSVLPTEVVTNMKTSEASLTNNFKQNYVHGRNNIPMNSADRNNYANMSFETGRSPYDRQIRNESTRNNTKRLFNNQVRITNDKPVNSMIFNVKDDCYTNFNQKARQRDFGKPKPDVALGKAPSVGILKKSTNSVLDTTIQFQRSPKDQNADDSYNSSKENSLSSKRVSFLLENLQ